MRTRSFQVLIFSFCLTERKNPKNFVSFLNERINLPCFTLNIVAHFLFASKEFCFFFIRDFIVQNSVSFEKKIDCVALLFLFLFFLLLFVIIANSLMMCASNFLLYKIFVFFFLIVTSLSSAV